MKVLKVLLLSVSSKCLIKMTNRILAGMYSKDFQKILKTQNLFWLIEQSLVSKTSSSDCDSPIGFSDSSLKISLSYSMRSFCSSISLVPTSSISSITGAALRWLYSSLLSFICSICIFSFGI